MPPLRQIAHASIIVHSYAYLIDPRASAPVTSQLPSSAIVVLDEAHNLDSSCTGVLSVDITRETLDRSVEAITALETRVSECVAGPAGTFVGRLLLLHLPLPLSLSFSSLPPPPIPG